MVSTIKTLECRVISDGQCHVINDRQCRVVSADMCTKDWPTETLGSLLGNLSSCSRLSCHTMMMIILPSSTSCISDMRHLWSRKWLNILLLPKVWPSEFRQCTQYSVTCGVQKSNVQLFLDSALYSVLCSVAYCTLHCALCRAPLHSALCSALLYYLLHCVLC